MIMSNSCADIQATLSTYLDAELEDADLREFEGHIMDCSECKSLLDTAESSHSALRAHLGNPPPASDLLKKRLSAAFDAEDRELVSRQRREWISWSLPAAASALAVAALAIFVWTDLVAPESKGELTSSEITQDAARKQLRDNPLFLSSGDRLSVGRSAASYLDRPVQLPRFTSTKIRLLGWMPAQLGGRQSVTFVYEVIDKTGRHEMNVHAIDLSQVKLGAQNKRRIDGADLWVDSAFGFNTVTYAESESFAYVFSSDLSVPALVDMVTNTDIVNMLSSSSPKR